MTSPSWSCNHYSGTNEAISTEGFHPCLINCPNKECADKLVPNSSNVKLKAYKQIRLTINYIAQSTLSLTISLDHFNHTLESTPFCCLQNSKQRSQSSSQSFSRLPCPTKFSILPRSLKRWIVRNSTPSMPPFLTGQMPVFGL
jgi:hypothetical protein